MEMLSQAQWYIEARDYGIIIHSSAVLQIRIFCTSGSYPNPDPTCLKMMIQNQQKKNMCFML